LFVVDDDCGEGHGVSSRTGETGIYSGNCHMH
jgi:hypothetical protein